MVNVLTWHEINVTVKDERSADTLFCNVSQHVDGELWVCLAFVSVLRVKRGTSSRLHPERRDELEGAKGRGIFAGCRSSYRDLRDPLCNKQVIWDLTSPCFEMSLFFKADASNSDLAIFP
jgi:hypothetical protein